MSAQRQEGLREAGQGAPRTTPAPIWPMPASRWATPVLITGAPSPSGPARSLRGPASRAPPGLSAPHRLLPATKRCGSATENAEIAEKAQCSKGLQGQARRELRSLPFRASLVYPESSGLSAVSAISSETWGAAKH